MSGQKTGLSGGTGPLARPATHGTVCFMGGRAGERAGAAQSCFSRIV
jgi:hypothetical protein